MLDNHVEVIAALDDGALPAGAIPALHDLPVPDPVVVESARLRLADRHSPAPRRASTQAPNPTQASRTPAHPAEANRTPAEPAKTGRTPADPAEANRTPADPAEAAWIPANSADAVQAPYDPAEAWPPAGPAGAWPPDDPAEDVRAVIAVTQAASGRTANPADALDVGAGLVLLCQLRLRLDQLEADLLDTAEGTGLNWDVIAAIMAIPVAAAQRRHAALRTRRDLR